MSIWKNNLEYDGYVILRGFFDKATINHLKSGAKEIFEKQFVYFKNNLKYLKIVVN